MCCLSVVLWRCLKGVFVLKRSVGFSLVGLLLTVLMTVQAQTVPVTFWHSMEAVEDAVAALAADFNANQDRFEVRPRYVGEYAEAQTRLIGALGTRDEPALFQAEIGFFPQLVADSAVQPLTGLTADLPEALVSDLYEGAWGYGELAGERYGLPWNLSTPVMYLNANALNAAGLEVPRTWEAFEETAAALSGRGTRGMAFVGDSWLFEAMVLSLGGDLVTADGRPNFTSPEALASLQRLKRMQDAGHLAYFSTFEATPAVLTFVRTRTNMAFASIANWPDIFRFSVGFDLAAAPLPAAPGGRVPYGGAQLVVMKNATVEERAGAFAFWQFLMEPESLKRWVEASYYIPVRRSVEPLLEDFYAEEPGRAAALDQLETAVPSPRVPQFNGWRRLIDEAMESVLKGRTSPEDALAIAQAAALEDLP